MSAPSRIRAAYDVCFCIACSVNGLLRTYRSSFTTAFLIHSRLVWYQGVSRSSTTSYFTGWSRSNGSMVMRSASKSTVSPSISTTGPSSARMSS